MKGFHKALTIQNAHADGVDMGKMAACMTIFSPYLGKTRFFQRRGISRTGKVQEMQNLHKM